MGSSSAINRASFRPHFAGRSPPFLVAALLVGFGILGFSYYSLYTQYSILELHLQALLENESDNQRLIIERNKDIKILETNLNQLKKDNELKEELLKSKKNELDKILNEMKKFKENHSEKNWVKIEEYKKLETRLQEAFNDNKKSENEANLKISQTKKQIDKLKSQISTLELKIKNLSNKTTENPPEKSSLSVSNLLTNVSVDTALHLS